MMIKRFRPLLNGTILHKTYRIIELKGFGGMGAVYEAEDTSRECRVAIKQIALISDESASSEPATNEELIDAFKHEAALLMTLTHPSIPKVTDYFCIEHDHYLVMELVAGDDLRTELLRRKRKGESTIPVGNVGALTVDLLNALEYLHSHNIIHRDIKPANIITVRLKQFKLVDFGLAKGRVRLDSSETVFSRLKGGTDGYAPLEQLEGQRSDERSDLYAVGATAYCLLTGTTPPSALTRASHIVAAIPDPLILVSEINQAVPLNFAQIIHKAMAMNPQQRYQTATEMRVTLAPTRDDYWKMLKEGLDEEFELKDRQVDTNLYKSLTEWEKGTAPKQLKEAMLEFANRIAELKKQHSKEIKRILHRIYDRRRSKEIEEKSRTQ